MERSVKIKDLKQILEDHGFGSIYDDLVKRLSNKTDGKSWIVTASSRQYKRRGSMVTECIKIRTYDSSSVIIDHKTIKE